MQTSGQALGSNVERPAFAIAEPTQLNTAYDEDVEVELLTTGELKVRNRLTGAVVYAPLDTAEMETIALLMHGLRVGDAEYQALNALNPYENAPPGFEPFSTPVGELSLESGGHSATTPDGTGGSGGVSAASPVLVRRSPDSEPLALDMPMPQVSTLTLRGRSFSESSMLLLGPSVMTLEGWDPMECVYAAHTIARNIYNAHNCQQTIIVGQSLANPTSVFPGGGMPWNGRTCTYQTQTWEVSYDGGANWEPFNVVVEICTYPAVQ
ncbi:MAG: hypothetical protein MUD17_09035 [Gemmatimonadaceae bacterium]|nr:hypothetical protein [Gemmatimonadaceae bacterium]